MDSQRLLTPDEFDELKRLFDNCEQTDIDDVEFFENGDHRCLYHFLVDILGFDAPRGRGPVWHFAFRLLSENAKYQLARLYEMLDDEHRYTSAADWFVILTNDCVDAWGITYD